MEYYLIYSMTREWVYPIAEWSKGFKKEWYYRCGHIKENYPGEIYLLEEPPPRIPLNAIEGLIHLDFADIDFLKGICSEIENYLDLYNVYIGKENLLSKKWVSYRAKQDKTLVQIRGGKESEAQICPYCGQLFYTPVGELYLTSREVGELPVYCNGIGQIIVCEEYYLSIKFLLKRYSKYVKSSKLPVLDHTRDFLPMDLNEVTPEMVGWLEFPPWKLKKLGPPPQLKED